jgi:glyoxylase-like metal-dependent hydrolase (beta-lactamase superfamily II)
LAHVPSKLRKKIEWLFRRAEGTLLPDAVRAEEGSHLDPDGARLALRVAIDEVDIAEATARLEHLVRAETDGEARRTYLEQYGIAGTRRFRAGKDTRIHQISVETFPRHVNNVYVVVEPGHTLLFDAGSGMPSSKRDLALGFAIVRTLMKEDAIRWDALDLCVVSHAHSDHCGGVNELKRTSAAKLAVHELDARVISAFEERLVLATKDIDVYWRRAGIGPKEREDLRELYSYGKRLFHSERVDRTLRDGDLVGAGYRVHHVPGHCPGLVCLQVHDVLLTSDHVLARITPHQFPQAITPFAGLEHYFQSLAKIRKLEGIDYALGGHEEPILDLRTRIDEIESFHRNRLTRVLEICESPHSVDGIAKALFPPQESYGVILALDEAGAHVEYLHALGRLRVDNLDEVAGTDDPVFRYVDARERPLRRSGAA